ncbi:LytR/AlgR family response regulator transcription factor [Tellurirhabdus bombi]|jgi:two-component system LytT family response regulator|uniref:LytR/AlgR family response regulator transcription factor n=1 Tax=Tellurirhabdus bombi TaxID=2907205 RepID=UPI001F3A0ABC|nr:LytTR family DNA-binding domain-containing protein [Tellurirhabdus bombi]
MESPVLPSSLSPLQPIFPQAYQRNAHRIALPYLNRTILLSVDDIVSLQGEGNYTYLFTRDKKRYLVSKTLKAFETSLNELMFLRIHKSTIVNLGYVQFESLIPDRMIRLTDGQEVSISRRRAKEIGQRLQSFRMTLVN